MLYRQFKICQDKMCKVILNQQYVEMRLYNHCNLIYCLILFQSFWSCFIFYGIKLKINCSYVIS